MEMNEKLIFLTLILFFSLPNEILAYQSWGDFYLNEEYGIFNYKDQILLKDWGFCYKKPYSPQECISGLRGETENIISNNRLTFMEWYAMDLYFDINYSAKVIMEYVCPVSLNLDTWPKIMLSEDGNKSIELKEYHTRVIFLTNIQVSAVIFNPRNDYHFKLGRNRGNDLLVFICTPKQEDRRGGGDLYDQVGVIFYKGLIDDSVISRWKNFMTRTPPTVTLGPEECGESKNSIINDVNIETSNFEFFNSFPVLGRFIKIDNIQLENTSETVKILINLTEITNGKVYFRASDKNKVLFEQHIEKCLDVPVFFEYHLPEISTPYWDISTLKGVVIVPSAQQKLADKTIYIISEETYRFLIVATSFLVGVFLYLSLYFNPKFRKITFVPLTIFFSLVMLCLALNINPPFLIPIKNIFTSISDLGLKGLFYLILYLVFLASSLVLLSNVFKICVINIAEKLKLMFPSIRFGTSLVREKKFLSTFRNAVTKLKEKGILKIVWNTLSKKIKEIISVILVFSFTIFIIYYIFFIFKYDPYYSIFFVISMVAPSFKIIFPRT